MSDKSLVAQELEKTALQTLDIALKSLEGDIHTAATALAALRQRLIELESKLRILSASHGLSEDQLHVFVSEIDSVGRTLDHYVSFNRKSNPLEEVFAESEAQNPRALERSMQPRKGAQDAPRSTTSTQHRSDGGVASGQDRRTRIIEVLRGVGEASIKDISDVVRDCSEKTIQRELNALIKDGLVQRKGQRRWSKYLLPE